MERHGSAIEVQLTEMIAALSLATDLGTGQPLEHALRTGLLSVRLGEALGLGATDLQDTFYVALLRSVGCTADAAGLAAWFDDEIGAQADLALLDPARPADFLRYVLGHAGQARAPLARAGAVAAALAAGPGPARAAAVAHCEVAQLLSDQVGLGAGVRASLGQVFERWDGKGLSGRVKGEALALPMRVVHVARDMEIVHRLGGPEAAVALVKERAGAAYDPSIAARFVRLAPALLAQLDAEPVWDALLAAGPGRRSSLSADEFDNVARAMGDFADLKSSYTVGHSNGVARLAHAAAAWSRLPGDDVTAIRRAGWLHDLGRIGVQVRIWLKPKALTHAEWERVRLHAYFTERILARPAGLARLGAVAALHHERLDGSGYHRGDVRLPVTARILAAADAYHAMTEPRPYRAALPPPQAADEIAREARAGRLDGEAVRAVLAAAGHSAGRRRRQWPAGLSEREVEVLRLIARGRSRREVAALLCVSERTAALHVQHIYDKAGVSTRAAATLFALQHDLLD